MRYLVEMYHPHPRNRRTRFYIVKVPLGKTPASVEADLRLDCKVVRFSRIKEPPLLTLVSN